MKILFLTIGDKTVASSRARVFGYEPFLKKEGIQYAILTFTSPYKSRRYLKLKIDTPLERLFEIARKIYIYSRLIIVIKAYDMLFLQKVVLPAYILWISKKLNKNILYDFDDALYLYTNVTHTLKAASCVIVSNKCLMEFVRPYNSNVRKIISPVEVNNHSRKKEEGAVTIGWIGSPETSRYLLSLMQVFKNLKENFKDHLTIELMGADPDMDFGSTGVLIKPWSLESEREFFGKIDIGIMPLLDDEWSRSKAGYKLLLYMSWAIPSVASPVGINREIITDGITGFLASSEKEWVEKLTGLIKNRDLRDHVGNEGKKWVKKYFSYEAIWPDLLDVIKSYSREAQ